MMAKIDIEAARLPLATASNPVLVQTGDAQWDRRIAHWLRLDALARADDAFGEYCQAGESHALATSRNEHETLEALSEAEEANVDRYLKPMWQAARELALTPAPNLAAALFKIELIAREDMDLETAMTRAPMDLVIEDMARLEAAAM